MPAEGSVRQRSLLTTREVADLIGCSVEHVRRLAREKRIPRIEVGRGYRFRYDRILAWLQECEEGG